MKYLSMRSVTSKSAITPSLSGRTATILPGVRPIIRLASTPTATICPLLVLSATTLGSFSTIPRPRTYTRVLAVPRSTAMSRPRNVSALLIGSEHLPIKPESLHVHLRTHMQRTFCELSVRPAYAAVVTVSCERSSTLVSVRWAPWLNEFREEDLNFPIGGFRGVGAVHHVLPDRQCVVAANRARRGLHRIGGPGHRAERLDGPLPLRDQRHRGAARDELDDVPEEGLSRVLGVVRLGGHAFDGPQIHRDHLQALTFNSRNDLADQVTADRVGLHQYKGALRHNCSLPLFNFLLSRYV